MHTKSAKKRVLTNAKARLRNKARKSAVKTAEKKLLAAVVANDMEKAGACLKEAFMKLDKASKSGTIHKNKCARKKSRLAKLLKKQTAA